MIKRTYIILPNELLQSGVSDGAKILYGVIASFTASGKECFAGNDKLNQLMGGRRTRRSIGNYLKELQQNGFLLLCGKRHTRRLTALNFVPPHQKREKPKDNENSTSPPAEIDFSFVHEDTRVPFRNFIEHCKDMGKRVTQKIAQAKYRQLCLYSSAAHLANKMGVSIREIRHEIILRAISGSYTNFTALPIQGKKQGHTRDYGAKKSLENHGVNIDVQEKRICPRGGIKLSDTLAVVKFNTNQ